MTFQDPPNPDEAHFAASDRDRVVRRGRLLRRRRRFIGLGAATTMAAVLAISAAAIGTGHHHRQFVIVDQPTTTVGTAPAATTSLVPPTTAPRGSTPPKTSVSTTKVPAPEPVSTRTPSPDCTQSQIRLSLTSEKSTYTVGQKVTFTLTWTNTGPTCTGVLPGGCGSSVSVANSAGHDAWDSFAEPNITPPPAYSCAAEVITTVRSSSASSSSITWTQDQCSADTAGYSDQAEWGKPNPDCPNTQVPDGTYHAVADESSTPITISIAG